MSRLVARCIVGAAGVALATTAAVAQNWPAKPVHVIVPLTAGSSADVIARRVAQRLSEQLGQPFIVENKPGAAGTIGVAAAAHAKPDGYTLLVHSSSYTITPITYPGAPYDTLRDLAGVTPLTLLPQAVVVAPGRGIESLGDLIARGKAKPDALTFGSAGVGTATHLSAERFRVAAGIDALHVPFKGAEAVSEVIAGRIDFTVCPLIVCLPMIKDKRLVPLAMSSGQRSARLPGLPTTLELGVPNSNYDFWVGLFVPAQTPRDIVAKLHKETVKALADPAVKESLTNVGAEQNLLEPAAFDQAIAREIASNTGLVKAAGIQVNPK
ncbi:Tripartite-type tricarboxylate transporter, receptor component TctC [Variovorax sp. HW608]|uniref:tripartite tricarboxylate transporter substrate binding protein n=1 Tax=Variovorax sp. HW608 TaxID=1034889 RepID=UPI00081FD912|nr:tripartite tricarboxylate transporter substrate binding protein [Variovorax sp. HW608]SCK14708.1 Tripartite-type tricarboxylate transporter, receptor component TctC [Variovorax sp. HW608]